MPWIIRFACVVVGAAFVYIGTFTHWVFVAFGTSMALWALVNNTYRGNPAYLFMAKLLSVVVIAACIYGAFVFVVRP
jgi:hypothetical protein